MDLDSSKKVAVRKVRLNYIKRKQDKQDEQDLERDAESADPWSTSIPRSEDQMLVPVIALVESGRKLTIEHVLHNAFRKITSVRINQHASTRSISLLVQQNPNYNIKPWEYTVKRLESYGDLEMAQWARKIKNFNQRYRESMDKYLRPFKNGDREAFEGLKKSSAKAAIARKAIQDNFVFHHSTLFFGEHNADVVGFNYCEKFLSEMGFSMESLIDWTKENGIPQMVETDCKINLNFAGRFLESFESDCESIQEGPEFVTSIVGVNGTKRKLRLKSIGVVEPKENGLLMDIYYVIYNKFDSKGIEVEEGKEKNRLSLKGIKTLVEDNNTVDNEK